MPATFGDAKAEYDALINHVGLVDVRDRTQIELTGDDRAKFLHNLSTNEIRKLTPGSGCEALLLDARGHIVGHVLVFCRSESLVLDAVPGQANRLSKHLDRYLIREKVTLTDLTPTQSELFIAGEQVAGWLSAWLRIELPTARLAHVETIVGDIPLSIRSVDLIAAPGFLVSCPADQLERAASMFREAGARPCGDEAFESARLEAGTPWYGRDISEKNLPQELARDDRLISFVKGCYIGQETVARIDALGHVNRVLSAVRFEPGAAIPEAGTALTSDGQPAGEVTSAGHSFKFGAPLALAYLRRGKHEPGTRLESALGPVEVVAIESGKRKAESGD